MGRLSKTGNKKLKELTDDEIIERISGNWNNIVNDLQSIDYNAFNSAVVDFIYDDTIDYDKFKKLVDSAFWK